METYSKNIIQILYENIVIMLPRNILEILKLWPKYFLNTNIQSYVGNFKCMVIYMNTLLFRNLILIKCV